MRPFSAILFLLLLSFLWALGHTMDWTGQNHHDYAPAVVAPVTPTPDKPFVRGTDLRLVNYNGKSLIGDHEQFEFAAGTKTPKGMSAANHKFLDQVATYLKANPDANLKLTGKYLRNEKNTSIQDNMGMARAAAIRDLLKKRGIATSRIELGSQIVKNMPANEPVSFNIKKTIAKGPKNVFEDMDFYFPTNSDQFTPSQQLINWASQAKKYFAENPGKTLYLTGHTDSDGDPTYNRDLGLRRARAVRTYLANSGIKTKIDVTSKGDTEPVSSNATATGKRQNRRVNARIN